MKTYLVTGGAGFIGSNLVNTLSQENKVIVVDNLSMGSVDNLNQAKHLTFIEGDVRDELLMSELLESQKFDYIFHLAAVASVADSVARPVETHQVNFESVLLLLELARKFQPDLKRFVFASSAAVYGDELTLPKKEESVIRPLTPYAIDKFAAEKYVLAYSHLYHVPTSAVRFFNVFGPNQNPSSPYSGVISILMDKFALTQKGVEANFTMFGDGEQSRDFIYVKDVVQALILVSNQKEAIGEVFNVGLGNGTTLNELVSFMGEVFEVELPLTYQEERAGDIRESVADTTKLLDLGFRPVFSVSEGVREYIASL